MEFPKIGKENRKTEHNLDCKAPLNKGFFLANFFYKKKSSSAQGLSPQVLRIHVACVLSPQTYLKVIDLLNHYRFVLSSAIQVEVSFPCLSWAIYVQISYPGTFLETRDQDLSFGTKIYGILFIIDGDISS